MRPVGIALLVVLIFAAGVSVGRSAGPATPTAKPGWTIAGRLARDRAYARAIAVDTGDILVVGGLDRADPHVTITTSELFDPSTGRTTVLPQKLLGRLNQTVTRAEGGRIVVAGGTEWLGDHWGSVANVDVYLPGSRTWIRATPMLRPRSAHGATELLDGRVFVTGGEYVDNNTLLESSEIYDPRADDWSYVEAMPRPRTEFSIATLPDGTVFVAGGFRSDGKLTSSTLIYDPRLDRWSDGPPMANVRLNHSMVQLPNGDLLFFGGEGSGGGAAELYSWRDRSFFYAGTLDEPRLVAQGAALPDGDVVAVGGLPQTRSRSAFDPTATAELWDPRTGLWQDIPDAPTKRAYAQLIPTREGLFRLSGVGDDERPFATVERLTWR